MGRSSSKTIDSKELPTVADLVVIEYNRLLNDKQSLNTKWRNNWAKGNKLLTDERQRHLRLCADNFKKFVSSSITYLSSISYNDNKEMDEDTFVHRYCHQIFEEIFNKTGFSVGNGESESSKERRLLDGYNHGKIFSTDLVYDGLYRCKLISKVLLPTENANFLNIITVVSTLYSLLVRTLLYDLQSRYFADYFALQERLDHPFYRGSGDFDQITFLLWTKRYVFFILQRRATSNRRIIMDVYLYPFEVHYAEEMIRECPKSIVLQCKRWNLDEYELEKESLLLTLSEISA
ncbi:unnamed protein product [Rhizophagus irregularis]|nr:unnamed protein product [Rhizophagus irregularis]